jgi:hypothetical protein
MADDEVRRDLERGLHFIYQLQTRAKRDVHETAVTILALLEELTERGLVEAEPLAERVGQKVKEELERMDAHPHVRLFHDGGEDKYADTDLPDIPCAELIPLCKARCCTLHVPLSKQDLDERVVRWDYALPYIILRGDDKYCVHSDPATRGCTVYEQRPSCCRNYDCREDARIWKDYAQRIPA